MVSYVGYVNGNDKPEFELPNSNAKELHGELKKCRLARKEVVELTVKVGPRDA